MAFLSRSDHHDGTILANYAPESRHDHRDLTAQTVHHLEYALKLPNRWHEIGIDKEGKDAVKRLEKAGLVEIRDYSNNKINPNF
jgi:hypothetical protein